MNTFLCSRKVSAYALAALQLTLPYMEGARNQIITWVSCSQLQRLTWNNQAPAALSRRIISSFRDLVRALQQFQHFIKPSLFFFLFWAYIYITFCSSQSRYMYIIFSVLPVAGGELGLSPSLVEDGSWDIHSDSREEGAWNLPHRKLSARSRQQWTQSFQ